jgi:D-3-phosphoglycerate dehydrogenase
VLRVLIPDPIHGDGVALLREHFIVDVGEGGDSKRRDAFGAADAVIVRNLPLDAPLIAAAPRLKVISKHGAGFDNIDLDAATRYGIVVANVPGANADAVAEATVGLMMAALRRVPEVDSLVRNGQYSARFKLQFEQLSGRTLGLVGLGNIGSRVARICSAGFGMSVLAFDPALPADQFADRRAEKVESLAALLAAADVVSLHLPLTRETFHLIGAAELRAMKSTAILVNAARGPLIDEAALADALAQGVIAGAGLDVLETEPPAEDSPILKAPNVVLSPHTAGNTVEASRRLAVSAAEIVIAALSGRRPDNLLNPQAWENRRR